MAYLIEEEDPHWVVIPGIDFHYQLLPVPVNLLADYRWLSFLILAEKVLRELVNCEIRSLELLLAVGNSDKSGL